MKIPAWHVCLPFILTFSATACAPLGKQPPQAQAVTAAQLGLSEQHTAAPVSPTWWTQLNDATLNQLIDTALAHSPNLAATAARIRQAQAGVRLTGSQSGIQAALSADGAGLYHESLSHPDSLAERIFGNDIQYGRIQLKARWTWDFWGQHHSELSAALGKKRALAYELAQAKLLLVQAVSAQYMQLQTLYAQQKLLQQRLDIKQQQEVLIHDRITAGLMPPSQLYPVQNAQHQLQSAIRDLNDKAEHIRHALAALSGQSPEALREPWLPENIGKLPPAPVHALTADLLGKRADLAAQREAVLSRGHLIDAAKAKFYPNVEIKALAGLSVLSIGDLPHLRTLLGGILPGVTLPVFTSGALKANLAQKQAEYDEQIARYNQSVYQSLKEAADALGSYQAATERIVMQQQTIKLGKKSVAAARDRTRAGLDTHISVLNAEDEVLQAQSQLLNLQLQQRVGWVSLNVAFGGGFSAEQSVSGSLNAQTITD